MIGIYKITSPTNRIYIGQSVNIESRFSSYKNLKCKTQVKLHLSFLKYGFEKHKFEIIEECDIKLLNERERYWQDFYNVLHGGLNCRLTTISDKSGYFSEESKLKMSISQTGKKASIETKNKLSLIHKGKEKSKEHKEKLSFIGKKRVFSKETKLKMKISQIGIKHTPERIQNNINSKLGKKLTPETKDKIGKANKGKIHSKEQNIKNGIAKSKIILNIETGIFYLGTQEVSDLFGINKGYLRKQLAGFCKNKTNFLYV
jgi:group I intron endonuclease